MADGKHIRETGKTMGKLKRKIYVNLKEVILDFTYRDFIYFIYNLGMDYYDGINDVSKEEWQDIFGALKDNYVQYEVERKIDYKTFRANMAAFINNKFYKHRSAYEVMTFALSSFGRGNKTAKLKYLIRDFEEHEEFDNEII